MISVISNICGKIETISRSEDQGLWMIETRDGEDKKMETSLRVV